MIRFHAWLAGTYLCAVAAIYTAVTLQPGRFYLTALACCVAAEKTCRAWDALT